MKKCVGCKRNKDVGEFSLRIKSKDGRQSRCKLCMKKYHQDYWKQSPERRKVIKSNLAVLKEEVRSKVVEHLRSNPCVQCGEIDLLKLEFDHLRDKKFNISDGIKNGFGWEKLKEEIDKCQTLCANCHAVKSAYQGNSWKLKFV